MGSVVHSECVSVCVLAAVSKDWEIKQHLLAPSCQPALHYDEPEQSVFPRSRERLF